MFYLVIKAFLSGIIVTLASEIAKRSPASGALFVSLPLVFILTAVWLWRDTGDSEQIAMLSTATFWLVLPTLPMLLVLPALMRHGVDFSLALGATCALTIVLYSLSIWLLTKFGIGI